jgi:hypothetical protein
MYVGCSKMNRVHLYKVLWAGADPYRLTSATIQVKSTGCTGCLQQICKLGLVPSTLLIFCVVLERQGCPQILVNWYLLGGLVLLSKFLKLIKLQNKNFVSHMC